MSVLGLAGRGIFRLFILFLSSFAKSGGQRKFGVTVKGTLRVDQTLFNASSRFRVLEVSKHFPSLIDSRVFGEGSRYTGEAKLPQDQWLLFAYVL